MLCLELIFWQVRKFTCLQISFTCFIHFITGCSTHIPATLCLEEKKKSPTNHFTMTKNLHYIQVIKFTCSIRIVHLGILQETVILNSILFVLLHWTDRFLIQNFYIKQPFFWQNHCGDSFHCENYQGLWPSTQSRMVLKCCKECKKFLYYLSDEYSSGLISPFILFSYWRERS